MSLPLTRRFAKAALLTAAGAASVVGATGSAGAVDLPQATELGGLSNLDTAGVTEATGDTTGTAAGLAGEVGGDALRSGMPTGKVLSEAGQNATPVAEGLVYETLDTANDSELGATATRTTYGALHMDGLQHGAVPAGGLTDDLPVGGLTGNGLSGSNLPTGTLLT